MAQITTLIDHDQQEAIRSLLIGRSVRKVNESTLLLDDGRVLTIHGNDGCGGCTAGGYWVEELNESPVNAIMAVEFEDEDTDEFGGRSYRVFVLAQDERIKLLQVDGDDGNGYYGTGYWIEVAA